MTKTIEIETCRDCPYYGNHQDSFACRRTSDSRSTFLEKELTPVWCPLPDTKQQCPECQQNKESGMNFCAFCGRQLWYTPMERGQKSQIKKDLIHLASMMAQGVFLPSDNPEDYQQTDNPEDYQQKIYTAKKIAEIMEPFRDKAKSIAVRIREIADKI